MHKVCCPVLDCISFGLLALTWTGVFFVILEQVRIAIAAASHRCIVLIINIELDPIPLVEKKGIFCCSVV